LWKFLFKNKTAAGPKIKLKKNLRHINEKSLTLNLHFQFQKLMMIIEEQCRALSADCTWCKLLKCTAIIINWH